MTDEIHEAIEELKTMRAICETQVGIVMEFDKFIHQEVPLQPQPQRVRFYSPEGPYGLDSPDSLGQRDESYPEGYLLANLKSHMRTLEELLVQAHDVSNKVSSMICGFESITANYSEVHLLCRCKQDQIEKFEAQCVLRATYSTISQQRSLALLTSITIIFVSHIRVYTHLALEC